MASSKFPKLELLTCYLLLSCSFSAYSNDLEIEELHQSIVKEGFFHKKVALGKQLGQFQSEEAKSVLMKLLTNDHYWNRTAAAEGLMLFEDNDVRTALIHAFLNDHMIENELAEHFRANPDAYVPLITNQYQRLEDDDSQEKLTELLSAWETDATDHFLKTIIENEAAPNRAFAFTLLADKRNPKHNAFIRTYIESNDIEVQTPALEYVLELGDKNDLTAFKPYLNKWHELTPLAYKAANKWESNATKEALFFNALTSKDTSTIFASLYAFENTQSNRILNELTLLTTEGPAQEMRRMASEQLLGYEPLTPETIQALQTFLSERFIPQRRTGWDTFVGHITVGLSTSFDYISERNREKAFNKTKEKIRKKLQILHHQ